MKRAFIVFAVSLLGATCTPARAANWEVSYASGQVEFTANYWIIGSYAVQYQGVNAANGKVIYRAVIGANPVQKSNGQVSTTFTPLVIWQSATGTWLQNGQTFESTAGATVTVQPGANVNQKLTWVSGGTGNPTYTFVANTVKKTFNKTLVNDSAFPMRVQIFDGPGGATLYDQTLAPGERRIVQLTTSSGKDAKVLFELLGAALDGAGNIIASPGTNLGGTETIPNNTMTLDGGSTAGSSTAISSVVGGTSASASETAPAGRVSTGGTTAALTEGTFVSGVNNISGSIADGSSAIVAAIRGLPGGTGTGGTGTDMSGVHSRLDTANTRLGSIMTSAGTAADKLTKIEALLDGGKDFNNSTALASAQGAAAGVAPYAGAKTGTAKPSTTFGGSGANLSFGTLQVGGQTLNFALFGANVAGTGLFWAAVRPVLLAGMCIGFLNAISGHLTRFVVALPQVHAQDTNTGPENIVPGASQAKTYGTAAAAVSVIFTGAAALVAVADTMVTYFGGGIASIFGAFSQPAGSVIGALDTIVPIGPGLAFWLMEAAAPYAMMPLYLGTAAILRFMKT